MNRELSIEFTRNPNIIRVKYDGEKIWEHYYENGVDFIIALHILENKNDREIYDYCKGYCEFTDEGSDRIWEQQK